MTAILVLFAAGSAWSVLQEPATAKTGIEQPPQPVLSNSAPVTSTTPAAASQEQPVEQAPSVAGVADSSPAMHRETSGKEAPDAPPPIAHAAAVPTAAQIERATSTHSASEPAPSPKAPTPTPAPAIAPKQTATPAAQKPAEKAKPPRSETASATGKTAVPAATATPEMPRVEPQPSLGVPVPPPPSTVELKKEEPKPITAVAPEREPRREVKAVSAAPLVKPQVKPQVIAANADRAWVKLNDQQTIIVPKGETVPGLGTFNGTVGGVAQFN